MNFRKRFTMLAERNPIIVRLVTVSILFSVVSNSHGQNEMQYFAEGKYALEKSDCNGALTAFNNASEAGRSNPQWVLYVAKTHECLGNYQQAIEHYVLYDEIAPGQTQVALTEKVGELSYKLRNAETRRNRFNDAFLENTSGAYRGFLSEYPVEDYPESEESREAQRLLSLCKMETIVIEAVTAEVSGYGFVNMSREEFAMAKRWSINDPKSGLEISARHKAQEVMRTSCERKVLGSSDPRVRNETYYDDDCKLDSNFPACWVEVTGDCEIAPEKTERVEVCGGR